MLDTTQDLKYNNNYFLKISFLKDFEIVIKSLEYNEESDSYFVRYFLTDQSGSIITCDQSTKRIINCYINNMLNKKGNA